MTAARQSLLLSLLALPLVTGVGCGDVEPDIESEQLEIIPRCPPWDCNSNGPMVYADKEIYEFNLDGEESPQGWRYAGFHSSTGQALELVMDGEKLVGVTATGVELRDHQLDGAEISIATGKVLSAIYKLRINGYSEVLEYWLDPAPVRTYDIEVVSANGHAAPLCSNPDVADNDDRTYGQGHQVLLFNRNRYDAVNKRVRRSRNAARWVNVACTGSAIFKLFVTRHTNASATVEYTATRSQATTMLKAWVMDACDTGDVITEPGHRIYLRNRPGWLFDETQFLQSYEGIWGPKGLVCLNEYRLQNDDHFVDKLELACGDSIQACTPEMLENWRDYGYILSSNGGFALP